MSMGFTFLDLIMLGLSTHFEKFFILREFVFVETAANRRYKKLAKKQQKNATLETKKLQVFHLDKLRGWIANEFPQRNLERVIDDFIFLLFLCGNDFLPAVPTLDIAEGALDYFFSLYKQVLQQEYMTHVKEEKINWTQIVSYLSKVAELEKTILNDRLKQEPCFKELRKKVHQLHF